MLFLDEDPITCANSTPVTLQVYTLNALKEAFEYVKANADVLGWEAPPSKLRPLMRLFVNDVLYSKANRDWLTNFYNTLALNHTKYCDETYPPLDCKYMPRRTIGEYYSRPLDIHSPVYDPQYSQLVLENTDVYSKVESVVDLSRLMLVQLEPTEDEFPLGTPMWLGEAQQDAYITFDPIKKTHVKIVRQGDRYRYFTAYISNNWKEVQDVPKEVDTIIDCLLNA